MADVVLRWVVRLVAALCVAAASGGVLAQVGTPGQEVPMLTAPGYKADCPPSTGKTKTPGDALALCPSLMSKGETIGNNVFTYSYAVSSVPVVPSGSGANGSISKTSCFRPVSGGNSTCSTGELAVWVYESAPAECPASAIKSGEQCWCPAGTKPDGGQCVADDCGSKAGKSGRQNMTVGWSRTSGVESSSAFGAMITKAQEVGTGTSVCDGKCRGSAFQDEKSSMWQATAPNDQGLYRVSGDYEIVYTGAACSATDLSPQLDPTKPSPACDGYLGQLNSKTVCVGKVGQADTAITSQTPIKKGNPAAGSAPDAPGRNSGSGGNGGGPAGSSDGSIRGGTGSATDGSGGTGGATGGGTGVGELPEVKMCGRPGEPPCKIDETGTPGQDAIESAKTANEIKLGTVMDNARTQLEQLSTGNGARKALPWSPSALLLPAGACAAQTTQTRLGTLRFDPCSSPIALLFRELMGWLVYMLTLLYAWRAASGGTGGAR